MRDAYRSIWRNETSDTVDYAVYITRGHGWVKRQSEKRAPHLLGNWQRGVRAPVVRLQMNRHVMNTGRDACLHQCRVQRIPIWRLDHEIVLRAARVRVLQWQFDPGYACQCCPIRGRNLSAPRVPVRKLRQLAEPDGGGDVVHVILVPEAVDFVVPAVAGELAQVVVGRILSRQRP